MLFLLTWIPLMCGISLIIAGIQMRKRRDNANDCLYFIIGAALVALSAIPNFLNSPDSVGRLLSVVVFLANAVLGYVWLLRWRELKTERMTVPIPKEWQDRDGPRVIGRWPKDPPRE